MFLSIIQDYIVALHLPVFVSRDINNAPSAERIESCGIAELENIEPDTPPDFQLSISFASYLSSISSSAF